MAADRSAPLHDGAEVALLPPVSGGSCGAGGGRLRDGAVDADTVSAVRARVEDAGKGAVVVFVGNVRNSFGGRPSSGSLTLLIRRWRSGVSNGS